MINTRTKRRHKGVEKMKEVWVEISFMDKPKELKQFIENSNRLALSQALMGLDYRDKDNVIGIKIAYVNEQD
jgi:hypothetical protein